MTSPIGLTEKARELLDFIEARIHENRVAPTFDEMAAAIGVKSKSVVHRLIAQLKERGHIQRLPGRARAIALRAEEPARLSLPADLEQQLTAEAARLDRPAGELLAQIVRDALPAAASVAAQPVAADIPRVPRFPG